jgi:hypothetical protein
MELRPEMETRSRYRSEEKDAASLRSNNAATRSQGAINVLNNEQQRVQLKTPIWPDAMATAKGPEVS